MGKQELNGCLPGAHACEHQVTNPFVDYLNVLQGSEFEHMACPDKSERKLPAPDALYRDRSTGTGLVIEHKSLIWPPHFAERHKNDHRLMNRVFDLLDPEIANGPYVLELPYLLRASRAEIDEFAEQICVAANANKQTVSDGGSISGNWAGRTWRLHEPWPLDSSDPEAGLMVSWNLFDRQLGGLKSTSVSEILQRLCESAGKKFGRYSTSKRILLLELKGDIHQLLFRDLLVGVVIPTSIDEIWTTYFEFFDDDTEDWMYERKWPV